MNTNPDEHFKQDILIALIITWLVILTAVFLGNGKASISERIYKLEMQQKLIYVMTTTPIPIPTNTDSFSLPNMNIKTLDIKFGECSNSTRKVSINGTIDIKCVE